MNKILSGRSIKTILACAAALAAGFFLICLMFYSLYENYCGELLNQELKHLLTISRANATYLQSYCQQLQENNRQWVENGKIRDFLVSGDEEGLKQIDAELKRLLGYDSMDDYLCLAVVDREGRTVSCRGSETGVFTQELADMALGEAIPEKGFWVDGSRYAYANAIRIYEGNRLKGAFVAVLDLSTIAQRLFRYVRIVNGGYLSMCDPDGTVILHPDSSRIGQKFYGTADGFVYDEKDENQQYIASAFDIKERGKLVLTGVDGEPEEVMTAFCRANIASSYYIIMASLPYSEAMAGIQTFAAEAVAAIVMLVLVFGGLLWAIFHQLRKNALYRAERRHLRELNEMLVDIQNRQNQLHQRENLQAVGVFASGIAHDFSNLLTPVLAYCELLMLQHHDEPELYDSLLEIYQSASASRGLARQLLSFSRSSKPNDSGNMPVNVGNLLDSCIRNIAIQLKNTVRIDFEPIKANLFVKGNQSMLYQAVLNLMTNACQSMEQGGTLTVNYGRIDAGEIQNLKEPEEELPFIGDGIFIKIRDTGCGMDEETLKQIFNAFFTTKKNTSGTGLGLMIVKNIINRHDGLIRVASTKGEGSCFTVVLPECVYSEDDEDNPEKAIMIVHAKKTENMNLYRKLKDGGRKTVLYTDPLEAIREFSSHESRYELLVTEYNLENFSGIVMSRSFHRIEPEFPVILMTTLIHPSQMVFDAVSAPDAVLLESADEQEFRDTIRKLLEKREEGAQ